MKLLKPLFVVLMLVAPAAHAAEPQDFYSAAAVPAPLHPELYSFADVYRLTVAGAAMANYPAADSAIRVASVQAPAGAEVQFSIQAVRQPAPWMLLLAGLAAAGWVARRRLGYAS
jgi:hypothetical protein